MSFIYAMQNDGKLLWYKHTGQASGAATWEGPKQIGSGWQDFKRVFFGGPTEPVGMNFTFDPAITAEQKATLLERHRFAFSRIMICNNLNAAEQKALLAAYYRPIAHGIDTNPNNNASANIGGSQIWVNFNNLFPLGETEIAQTLIHEMMHCAGFNHPNKRTPPAGMSCDAPDPSIFDCSFDSGVYFGSPPLQAELCIAGSQSDLLLMGERAVKESCVVGDDGVASIKRA
jgi:hypothetical protein